MSGKPELSQLAYLLKLSAITARRLAHEHKADAAEIHWLAHQIEEIAESMSAIGTIESIYVPSDLKMFSSH